MKSKSLNRNFLCRKNKIFTMHFHSGDFKRFHFITLYEDFNIVFGAVKVSFTYKAREVELI